MPLVTTTEMFKKAYEGGYAIGAFNVNNMEIVQGLPVLQRSLTLLLFFNAQQVQESMHLTNTLLLW